LDPFGEVPSGTVIYICGFWVIFGSVPKKGEKRGPKSGQKMTYFWWFRGPPKYMIFGLQAKIRDFGIY